MVNGKQNTGRDRVPYLAATQLLTCDRSFKYSSNTVLVARHQKIYSKTTCSKVQRIYGRCAHLRTTTMPHDPKNLLFAAYCTNQEAATLAHLRLVRSAVIKGPSGHSFCSNLLTNANNATKQNRNSFISKSDDETDMLDCQELIDSYIMGNQHMWII